MCIEQKGADILIRVFIQPKSSKNEIIGPHNDAIKIKITAPPIDGEANTGLIEFLAKLFKIPKRDLQIIKGETSRQKTLLAHGVDFNLAQTLLKIL